jgi:hypothetical protein
MVEAKHLKVGTLVKHKGGKLYRIDNDYQDHSKPRFVTQGYRDFDPNEPKVWATQWQVNEKYPEGREYQASRALKLKDLSYAEFDIERFK